MSMNNEESVVEAFEGLLDSENTESEEVLASEEVSEQAEELEAEAESSQAEQAYEDEAEEVVEDEEVVEEVDPGDPGEVEFQLNDGQVIRTTKDELANSFMRQRDYTQKTQAHAAEKQNFEAEKAQFHAEMNRQIQALSEVIEPEINWAERYEEDPYNAPKEHLEYQDKQKKKAELQYQNQQYFAQQSQAYLQEQRQLLTQIIPEWSDAKVAAEENPQVSQFLVEEIGLNPQDVKTVQDARLVKLALLAMRQHKLQSQATKVVRKKVSKAKKVLRPGSAAKKVSSKQSLSRKIQEAGQLQTTDAFAAVFEEIM